MKIEVIENVMSNTQAEINNIKAEGEERINQITMEIRQLENKYKRNIELFEKLRGFKNVRPENDSINNSLLAEIKSLKEQRTLARNTMEIQISRVKGTIQNPDDPLGSVVERLKEELTLLKKEQDKLIICAQIPGIIGTVKFKEGEKV